MFARASWADGRTETYSFTEIDRSVSGGILVKGSAWRRRQDSVGVAFARNGLSKAHRNYLAAGGMGFFIGDGRLNYRPEAVFEVFYSLSLTKAAWVTLNWQHIRNPSYNADRGPTSVASLRLHTEF
jgi:carbohydrate-selective porin OprB